MITKSSFYSFELARKALSNAQLGLDVTGHNMSNVSTTGYTRQRLDQVSWSVSGISKYQLNNSYLPGLGSQAIGISQLRDPFLDARYRTEASKNGELAVKESGMADLENIFDEVMSDALANGLSNIVQALTDAQKQPDADEYSSVARTRVEQFTQMLNSYSNQLDNMRTQQLSDLKISVEDEVNVMLEKIAALNDSITKLEVYGNPANELRDERNLLLDQLSGYIDIQVEETKKEITPEIAVNYLKISIKGTDPAITLVDRDKYGSLAFNHNTANNTAEITMTDVNGTAYDEIETDAALKAGGLRGYLDVINGRGTYVDTSAGEPEEYKGIAFAQAYLDQLAEEFAAAMNDTNAANGGGALIDSADGVSSLNAANISLSQIWRDNPSAIILSSEGNLGNPIEAMRFVEALTSKAVDADFAQGLGLTNATLEDVIAAFQGVVGLEKSRATSLLETSMKVISSLDDQRMAISGVSENEEAINMMTYSNYYNAAARYMTTLDEALDKVINGMGTVGR